MECFVNDVFWNDRYLRWILLAALRNFPNTRYQTKLSICCWLSIFSYQKAAEMFAQTQNSFEEVALKFIRLQEKEALKTFLLKKLAGLRPQVIFWKINTLINARVLFKTRRRRCWRIFTGRNEVVATKLCFYTCLWFCPQGGGSPGRENPPPPDQAEPPPPRARQTTLPGKQTPEYGLRAAGTHPTGMHSCLNL